MDVKRIIRERRLQEATEEIRRTQASAPHDSAQSQREFAARRVSRQVSARSSRPSSQFGDAESPPEWYQHEEGNHTQVYEPKNSAGILIITGRSFWTSLKKKRAETMEEFLPPPLLI